MSEGDARDSWRLSDDVLDCHPLWSGALAVAANEAVEHWWLREALLWQECLRCSGACYIVVTYQGRVLYQKRREGRQGFGGGRILHGLLLKCHSARRELLDESGLHYTNTACTYLSPVQLVA